jgi:hypothetical protein
MTTTFYSHWRDLPESTWRWSNFSPAEIACRGTGKLLINEPALDKLQALRDLLGKPLVVRSAYRSPEHNRAVGGATRSKHMDGAAFDIAMTNHDPVAFEAAAREVGFPTSVEASVRLQRIRKTAQVPSLGRDHPNSSSRGEGQVDHFSSGTLSHLRQFLEV